MAYLFAAKAKLIAELTKFRFKGLMPTTIQSGLQSLLLKHLHSSADMRLGMMFVI
jgi:hypothetical protein